MVNYSCHVAFRPLLRLASWPLTGHSARTALLTIANRRRREHSKHRRAAFQPRDSPESLEDLPMSDAVKVGFVAFSAAARGILVVFCDDALKFGAATGKALGSAANIVKRAAETGDFKGKSGSTLDILAPEGIKVQRLIVIGAGKAS